jgi:hypothetical protein
VPARAVTTINDYHLGIGGRNERIDECHTGRAGTDDEIVGLQNSTHVVPLLNT